MRLKWPSRGAAGSPRPKAQEGEVEARPSWHDVWWKKLRRRPMSLLGAAILACFAAVAAVAPLIAPPEPPAPEPPLSGGCRLVMLADDALAPAVLLYNAARWTFYRAGRRAGLIPVPDPESDEAEGPEAVKEPLSRRAGCPEVRNVYSIPQDGYSPDPLKPSSTHWFGTAQDQYDLYYGMVWGTRMAFKVALSVVAVSLCLGIVVGGLAGFYGSWVDEVLMRLTDIVLAFPDMVLSVVIAAVLVPKLGSEHSLLLVMISVTLVSWPSYARLLRGDVLSIREREFVLAARALGASDARIFLRHILPNCIYPLIVVATLSLGRIVITAAALSFLGLGSPPGSADWGQLIALSRNWILGTSGNPFQFWHTFLIPGGAIFMFVLGWNLLGDALRDILDPRQK